MLAKCKLLKWETRRGRFLGGRKGISTCDRRDGNYLEHLPGLFKNLVALLDVEIENVLHDPALPGGMAAAEVSICARWGRRPRSKEFFEGSFGGAQTGGVAAETQFKRADEVERGIS